MVICLQRSIFCQKKAIFIQFPDNFRLLDGRNEALSNAVHTKFILCPDWTQLLQLGLCPSRPQREETVLKSVRGFEPRRCKAAMSQLAAGWSLSAAVSSA
ncbi:hypothetical protein AMECASPLE_017843 [Ameca splendens]|uniref:Uncharacterized protein n=1 Tax=Ameca splendens TaxID=208324 RepID=A0ABV0XRJ8_9TELE